MLGAAVKLDLERHMVGGEIVDHVAELERIVGILGAVQDQVHALGVLGPALLVAAERAVDRDIGGERRAGRAELDADRAAEAVADERDPCDASTIGILDHRIEPGLRPCFHQRAVLPQTVVCATISSTFFGSMPYMSVANTT